MEKSADNLIVALAPFYRGLEPALTDKLLLLVAEALHRVATMDEVELRNFLPWLLYNDGELAKTSNAELSAIQGVVAQGLPPRTWPRP